MTAAHPVHEQTDTTARAVSLMDDPDTCRRVFQTMTRIATTDGEIQKMLAAGELQFQYYPCGGQEAIPAAIEPLLRPDDHMVTTYRGIHDIVAKGTPVREIMAEISGRAAGTSKGKGGPMHLSDPNSGLMVTTGIVGAGLPIADGLGLAARLDGTDRVVVVSFGDGATNIGAFNESLNLASLWQLPVIFVCQNNLYAEYTSYADSTRSQTLAKRADGYEMPGVTVDGTDPAAVHAAAAEAVARARSGGGPTLLECVAYRLQGHSFGSDEGHMDQAELAAAREAAPLIAFRRRLIDHGVLSEDAAAAIETQARDEVADALDFARSSEPPGDDELYTDVFADTAHNPELTPGDRAAAQPDTPDTPAGRPITYCQAVNEALDQALANDDRVILLGEDIADPAGGIVKATAGLSTKHGADRVRATPISEQAIVGSAIGASLAGFKPVAEIMVVDFTMVCMDQIANHAAKLRYMSGGRTGVGITIRTLCGGNVGSFGAQHSQSLEAWFAHTPGLKVVAPATPADAKGLLASCIDDPDPCIVIEAMRLYFGTDDVPEGDHRVPLGSAAVRREGRDVTIVSYSWPLAEALAAAEILAADGIDAEVIDLRSIVPLDKATVLASVVKTKRALVVHGAVEFCGFGAELATLIHTELHGELAAPVARYGGRYTPIPFTQGLEAKHFPDAAGIVARARALVQA